MGFQWAGTDGADIGSGFRWERQPEGQLETSFQVYPTGSCINGSARVLYS